MEVTWDNKNDAKDMRLILKLIASRLYYVLKYSDSFTAEEELESLKEIKDFAEKHMVPLCIDLQRTIFEVANITDKSQSPYENWISSGCAYQIKINYEKAKDTKGKENYEKSKRYKRGA